ncbi:hypothetical protein D9M71_461060 [compost metagenome]
MVLGGHVVDALGGRYFVAGFQGVTQGAAELRRARLGLGGGLGNGLLQQQAGVEGVGAEGGGLAAVELLVGGYVLAGDGLGRVAVGHLVQHQHQAGGEDGAFHLLAAELEEVRQGGAVGLVHLPAIALVEQGGLRQHRGAARRGHQHGVGAGGQHLQALAGDGGVLALEALAGHQLDAVFGSHGGHHPGPVLAIGIGGADETQGLHAAGGHVLHQGLGDQVIVLGGLEHPFLLLVHRQHHGRRAHRRQQGHPGLGGELDHPHRVR